MIWNWDKEEKWFFAASRYHDDGDPFWYYIKKKWFGYELSGTLELVPKPKRFISLRRAIDYANKIEESE